MEIRQIWQIIRRRWRLPVLLTVLVGLFSLLQMRPWQPAPPSYSASLRMLVGVLPAAEADRTAYDPRYYAWLTSEYLVDDFTEVVRSDLFARNVSARLCRASAQFRPRDPGQRGHGKQHRIITLSFTWRRR